MKNITLPPYGSIKVDDLRVELLDTPEVQRLQYIHQLGLAYQTYPGAHQKRLQHALGVSHIAGRIADRLGLDDTDRKLVMVAGELHDLAHTPFSHALEPFLEEDHMELTRKLITGERVLDIPKAGSIPKILNKYGINPDTIGDLICKKYTERPYLQQIIFSEVDADQLDYLLRDSYFTFNQQGVIELERLLDIMLLKDDELMFMEKGTTPLEGFFVARNAMYKEVYVHHTVRIAERMLQKSFELNQDDLGDFLKYPDEVLLYKLCESSNKKASELAVRIMYRDSYKLAFKADSTKKRKYASIVKKLIEIGDSKLENQLAKETKLEEGDILVEFPTKNLELAEPRLKEVNVKLVRGDGSVIPLTDVSDITKVLMKKEGSDSLFSVYCAKENKDKVNKAVENYIQQYK